MPEQRDERSNPPDPGFWEDPEQIEQFARRDPDHRLLELIEEYPDPCSVRVLDLGCAGGRNTELLVRRGFDTYALDGSRGMVEATRARIAGLVEPAELERRVLFGKVDDLSLFADDFFDLVVALGIFHVAASDEEWARALDEAARVTRPGGRCLVANFAPGTGRLAAPGRKIEGTRFTHDGLRAGRSSFLTAPELDAEFSHRGFTPEVASETVDRRTEDQRRVTVNALYRKANHP